MFAGCGSSTFCIAVDALATNVWMQLVFVFTDVESSPNCLPLVFSFIVSVLLLTQVRLAFDLENPNTKNIFIRVLPKSIFTSTSFRQDVKMMFLNIVLQGLVTAWLFSTDSKTYWSWSEKGLLDRFSIFHSGQPSLSILLQITYCLFVLVGYDFGYYISHVLLHKVPCLWELHKVHHSVEKMSIVTNNRFHIIDSFLTSVLAGVGAGIASGTFATLFGPALLKESASVFVWINVVVNVISILFHSHVWWSFGPFEWFAMSPAMHMLHHGLDTKYHDKNFGSAFSIFDNLFGTAYRTDRQPPATLIFGIQDDFDWKNASVWQYFFCPMRRLVGKIAEFVSFTQPKDKDKDESRNAA